MATNLLPGKFLTAQWRDVVMINYQADPAFLQDYVPAGTELDFWQGKTFVSLVGLHFVDTRVLGCCLPWHRNFAEVNLRIYVRRRDGESWKRGVVFIKEIVPRRLIAWAARRFYNENYLALPMHSWSHTANEDRDVGYEWRFADRWNGFETRTRGAPQLPAVDAEETFIAEHYWGYVRQRDGTTVEYQVEHPPWRVWRGELRYWEYAVEKLYGEAFVDPFRAPPTSVFVAEGSAVLVRRGRRLG